MKQFIKRIAPVLVVFVLGALIGLVMAILYGYEPLWHGALLGGLAARFFAFFGGDLL